MPLLYNIVNGFAEKHSQQVDDFAFGVAHAIPVTDSGEREMRRLHTDWLKRAELHRPYYRPDARYVWTGDGGWAGRERLACLGEVVFVRRDSRELYSASGKPSWRYFFTAGFRGLTTDEPPKPRKESEYFVSGKLTETPDQWEVTYH